MTARDKFSQAVNNNSLPGCGRNRRWKWTLVFMLCASSCCRAATEEEQAQSKKGLKKQQKEAEKAAKKAEKQAKLVSVCVCVCVYTSDTRLSSCYGYALQCGVLWVQKGTWRHRRGKSLHCLSIPATFDFVCLLPNKFVFLFCFVTSTLLHDMFVVAQAADFCQSPLIV